MIDDFFMQVETYFFLFLSIFGDLVLVVVAVKKSPLLGGEWRLVEGDDCCELDSKGAQT